MINKITGEAGTLYNWKKICGVTMTVILLTGIVTISSFAASRKKITSVNVEVESQIELGARYGEEVIEIDVRGKNYTYDYYEIENFGFEWVEDDVPEITIYLRANEGYYFALTKASAVKLTGATYVKASKQDSSETLALRVKLPSMAEMVGQETQVVLTQGGYASWDEVRGAGSYELRLYRDGTGIGSSYQSTEQLFYDYTSQMKKPGSYQVKVRAVNKQNMENKGKWMESEVLTITKEMAEAIRNGTAAGLPVKGEWKNEGNGWWYCHEDGSYTTNNWEEINGEWYFFGEDGYMKTGWLEWNGQKYYCKEETGEMLRNTTTPDGYILDKEGHLKNN